MLIRGTKAVGVVGVLQRGGERRDEGWMQGKCGLELRACMNTNRLVWRRKRFGISTKFAETKIARVELSIFVVEGYHAKPLT
jgi:hypothetical protein